MEKVGDRKLKRAWDDDMAEYKYTLLSYEGSVIRVDGYFMTHENWLNKADGDLDWAKRIAAHYNLELPE